MATAPSSDFSKSPTELLFRPKSPEWLPYSISFSLFQRGSSVPVGKIASPWLTKGKNIRFITPNDISSIKVRVISRSKDVTLEWAFPFQKKCLIAQQNSVKFTASDSESADVLELAPQKKSSDNDCKEAVSEKNCPYRFWITPPFYDGDRASLRLPKDGDFPLGPFYFGCDIPCDLYFHADLETLKDKGKVALVLKAIKDNKDIEKACEKTGISFVYAKESPLFTSCGLQDMDTSDFNLD